MLKQDLRREFPNLQDHVYETFGLGIQLCAEDKPFDALKEFNKLKSVQTDDGPPLNLWDRSKTVQGYLQILESKLKPR
jgi:hypothetical protein